MGFKDELQRVLPADLPHRDRVIASTAKHLELIVAANEYMNLTRITSFEEAAIKHVFDSLAPFRWFQNAKLVLDAGTGAGFPGLPLALVLPDVPFLLCESTGKKARFVESVVEELGLTNVNVICERAEIIAQGRHPEIITARAVAPLPKLLDLFGSLLTKGTRLLLYKGPDIESELQGARRHRFMAEVLEEYELPDAMGRRTLLEIRAQGR